MGQFQFNAYRPDSCYNNIILFELQYYVMYSQEYNITIPFSVSLLFVVYYNTHVGSHVQPEIGENTVEILKELNYSDEQIQQLVQDKTVHQYHSQSKL